MGEKQGEQGLRSSNIDNAPSRKSGSTTRTQGLSASQPTVLLYGESSWNDSVEASLGSMDVLVLKAAPNVDLETHFDPTTLAVIFTAAGPKSDTSEAVSRLHDIYPRSGPALFALVSRGTSADRIRELYRVGTTAVLEWPRERETFPPLLAELAAIEGVRGRATRPDLALQRSIEAHLSLDPGLKHGVRLTCRDGVVSLAGQTESLWNKIRLQEILSAVPGVRAVMVHNLWVPPTGHSDRDLSKSVRQLLQNTSAVDHTTLSFGVRNGYLTIAGTLRDRQELQRVRDMLVHMRGIRGIENLTTVSPSSKKQDHASAVRIRKALRTVFPSEQVNVAVFAGVAVLSGRVKMLSTKQKIQRRVELDRAVGRVINKVDVAPS